MRESYDRTGETRAAVIEGIGRTGRLVTSAALILVLSFLAMSTGPQADIKILATGLGAGILVDATLIRCLLVPAFVSLLGAYSWWLPRGPRAYSGSSPHRAAIRDPPRRDRARARPRLTSSSTGPGCRRSPAGSRQGLSAGTGAVSNA
jgi:RND superfamily putative drug exporter